MEFPNPLDFPAFPLADSFAARLPGSFAFCSLQSQRDGLLIMSLLRHKRVEPQCPRLSRFQRFGLLCAFAFAFAIASALLQCFNKYSFDLKAAAATFSNCGAHLFEAKSKGPTVGVRKILFCRGGGAHSLWQIYIVPMAIPETVWLGPGRWNWHCHVVRVSYIPKKFAIYSSLHGRKLRTSFMPLWKHRKCGFG